MRSCEPVFDGSPLVARGYVLTYRPGQVNFCPGCGQTHWHVGRSTAECAWCDTALPIAVQPRLDPSDSDRAARGWRAWLNPAGWRTLVPAS